MTIWPRRASVSAFVQRGTGELLPQRAAVRIHYVPLVPGKADYERHGGHLWSLPQMNARYCLGWCFRSLPRSPALLPPTGPAKAGSSQAETTQFLHCL